MFLQTVSVAKAKSPVGFPALPAAAASRNFRSYGSTHTSSFPAGLALEFGRRSSFTKLPAFAIPKENPQSDLNTESHAHRIASSNQNQKESKPEKLSRFVSNRSPVTLSFTTSVGEDPFVHKLRAQLGSLHTVSLPALSLSRAASFLGFFLVGSLLFDRLWTSRKAKKQQVVEQQSGIRPQVPTSLSMFLEKDLQRKESVEWVNMVLGKLWKVYQSGLENWLVGLLQPIIDDLKKPPYVERVQIKQFSLGEEPISVRSVERRTSRRANDLQYNIGLRYTGGARMLLMLSLKLGFIPILIPVGVKDLDVDGEIWVKLQLVPSAPWVGTATWAFVSLPKIKLNLAPFRLFNIMAIPVLSMFLTKLLTEDLPRLFVRPNKTVLNFKKGQAIGPSSMTFRTGGSQEGNKDFAGELSVVLVDARKLDYVLFGKTDPYVVLVLGDQVVRSKRNSQTTVIGPPGSPIWNQDFQLLVADPQKQKLIIKVRDSFGLGTYTVGTGEVELSTLLDTVPGDRIVTLKGGWGLFGRKFSGEVLLRLTYKAYVEDEEDDGTTEKTLDNSSDDDMSSSEENDIDEFVTSDDSNPFREESFMDTFVALLASEEFQGIVASDPVPMKSSDSNDDAPQSYRQPPAKSKAESTNQEKVMKGSVTLWFALITGITVLVSISLDGSNFFNP